MPYATVDDLTTYLAGDTPPAGAGGLLARASEIVDEILIGAIYDTDTDGNPLDPAVAAALRDATCAQAMYLAATGDQTGALAQFGSASAGAVSFSRMDGTQAPTAYTSRFAPAAVGVLRVAGLLPVTVLQPDWIDDIWPPTPDRM